MKIPLMLGVGVGALTMGLSGDPMYSCRWGLAAFGITLVCSVVFGRRSPFSIWD